MDSRILKDLRRALAGMTFVPLSREETENLREGLLESAHNNMIEGLEPGPDSDAIFEMLLEARAPQDVRDKIFDLHIIALGGSASSAD